MSGNTFGKHFKVTTFGESHGPALGCIIDGCPSGIKISNADIEKDLRRRRPGAQFGSRNEDDIPEILSGTFKGKTTGSPIAIVIRNTNQKPEDYENLKDIFRPAHADYSWEAKYGFRDYRGGGRSSGRETIGRVAAGAVAKKLLSLYKITIKTQAESTNFNYEDLRALGDSAGGVIFCRIKGAPAGLGEPVFDKLDARLACAIISIGACKGIEFGTGFPAAAMRGSEYNLLHSGGILGGISNGQDISFRAAFKPTPSISMPQMAFDKAGNEKKIKIKGSFDISVVPRAVPVVEAMAAIVIADFLLLSRSSKL